jgi:hypothetical protein
MGVYLGWLINGYFLHACTYVCSVGCDGTGKGLETCTTLEGVLSMGGYVHGFAVEGVLPLFLIWLLLLKSCYVCSDASRSSTDADYLL